MDQKLPIVSVRNEVISATTAPIAQNWPSTLISSILMIWPPLESSHQDEFISTINNNQKIQSELRHSRRKKKYRKYEKHGIKKMVGTSCINNVWSLENVHYKTFGVRTIVLTATYTLFGSSVLECGIGTTVVEHIPSSIISCRWLMRMGYEDGWLLLD